MLSLRLAIVTVAAGLCLWGLFSLLDSLQQPGLLRSGKATVVKGCDSPTSGDAARLCPTLFCQKALLDTKLLPANARFAVTMDRDEANGERLIAGRGEAPREAARYFACRLIAMKVVDARVIDPHEFGEIMQPGVHRWIP